MPSPSPSPTAFPPERERVLDLVVRHGWNATAFQTLETGYHYFFHGEEACVAYVDTGRAWVAAGGPIAATDALAEVARAFVRAARAGGKRACFFATEARLQLSAGEGLGSLCVGEQPVWDPRVWPAALAGHSSLREQLRRARAKGVRIREVTAAELGSGVTRDEITRVAERWLSSRSLAPMGFLLRVEPFRFPAHRRCFVAEAEGHVIGFAGLVPVPTRSGWFIEDLVRDPKAPNGTGELLVDAVMRWAGQTGCSWLTLGLTPLSGNLPPALRVVRRSTKFLYDFEGLRAYKAKLRPDSWSPIYVSYPTTQSAFVSVTDVLAAFTCDGFLRFGLRSLLRRPLCAAPSLAAGVLWCAPSIGCR